MLPSFPALKTGKAQAITLLKEPPFLLVVELIQHAIFVPLRIRKAQAITVLKEAPLLFVI